MRVACTLAFAVLISACRRVPAPGLDANPAALQAEVERTQASVQGVRGNARVRVESPGSNGSLEQFLAAEKPDRVRIEALDFFGNIMAVLVAADGHFSLYDARGNVFYRGTPTAENLSRLLPVALSPAALATILCGSAPLIAQGKPSLSPNHAGVFLDLSAPPWEQRIELSDGALVKTSELRWTAPAAPPEVPYALRLEDRRSRGGAAFPNEIRLEARDRGVKVAVSWRHDVEVNPKPDPALFTLEVPKGARVVDLLAGQAPPELQLPLKRTQ